MEWYLELCAAVGRWAELQSALKDKLHARRQVQWYHRLNHIAKEKMKEASR